MQVYSEPKYDETNIINYLIPYFPIAILNIRNNHRPPISTDYSWMWDYRVVHAYMYNYFHLFCIFQSRNSITHHVSIPLFHIRIPVSTDRKVVYM